jgi:DNA-binding NarL/FixJ family response regulator
VLEGIRTLVGRSRRGWEICGEARNGADAIEMVKRLRPDIAVLDITMPVMNGLHAAAEIAGLGLGCRTLIFTMHESERLAVEVRSSGAQGYVLKSQAARDLIRAIDYLVGGKTFFGAPPESEKEEQNKLDPGTLLCRAFAFAAV